MEKRGVFVRGDANHDRELNIADASYLLNYLFREGEEPQCFDAADVNDDGGVDISDTTKLLFVLFDGEKMPAPFPGEGIDSTPDDLGCDASFGFRAS